MRGIGNPKTWRGIGSIGFANLPKGGSKPSRGIGSPKPWRGIGAIGLRPIAERGAMPPFQ